MVFRFLLRTSTLPLKACCRRNLAISVDITNAHALRNKYVLLEADASMHLPKSTGLNSKLISFVRHAEGIHNAVGLFLFSGNQSTQMWPLTFQISLQAASDHKDEFYAKLFNSRMLWDSPLTLAGTEQVLFALTFDRLSMPLNCRLHRSAKR
jgi:hypothetical protein